MVVCFKPLLIGNTMPSYRYLGGIPPSESSSTSSSSKSSFSVLFSQVLWWVLLEHTRKRKAERKPKGLDLNMVVIYHHLLLLLLAIPCLSLLEEEINTPKQGPPYLLGIGKVVVRSCGETPITPLLFLFLFLSPSLSPSFSRAVKRSRAHLVTCPAPQVSFIPLVQSLEFVKYNVIA